MYYLYRHLDSGLGLLAYYSYVLNRKGAQDVNVVVFIVDKHTGHTILLLREN